MRSVYASATVLLCAGLMARCQLADGLDDAENTRPRVTVQVDLQFGLAGNQVALRFNGEESVRMILSDAAPFSGPLATFDVALPRGENHLNAVWHIAGAGPLLEENRLITLGDAPHYYLGIGVTNGKLVLSIQEEPFGYL